VAEDGAYGRSVRPATVHLGHQAVGVGELAAVGGGLLQLAADPQSERAFLVVLEHDLLAQRGQRGHPLDGAAAGGGREPILSALGQQRDASRGQPLGRGHKNPGRPALAALDGFVPDRPVLAPLVFRDRG
jgi:hypothetical protein